MKKTLSILALATLVSCRCYTDYRTIGVRTENNIETTICASARMMQGQYEYLRIEILIKRMDSLFVSNISVKPILENEVFYPWLNNFVMNSYYYETQGNQRGELKWKNYFANTFEELPTINRQTNKDSIFIKYMVDYNSKKPIKFKNFAADIEVQLMDKSGKTVIHKRRFDFTGERECIFSLH